MKLLTRTSFAFLISLTLLGAGSTPLAAQPAGPAGLTPLVLRPQSATPAASRAPAIVDIAAGATHTSFAT